VTRLSLSLSLSLVLSFPSFTDPSRVFPDFSLGTQRSFGSCNDEMITSRVRRMARLRNNLDDFRHIDTSMYHA